jgi:hypothetical protein
MYYDFSYDDIQENVILFKTEAFSSGHGSDCNKKRSGINIIQMFHVIYVSQSQRSIPVSYKIIGV